MSEPISVVTFESRDFLLAVLRDLPPDKVIMVGYIDARGDVRALSQKDLDDQQATRDTWRAASTLARQEADSYAGRRRVFDAMTLRQFADLCEQRGEGQ